MNNARLGLLLFGCLSCSVVFDTLGGSVPRLSTVVSKINEDPIIDVYVECDPGQLTFFFFSRDFDGWNWNGQARESGGYVRYVPRFQESPIFVRGVAVPKPITDGVRFELISFSEGFGRLLIFGGVSSQKVVVERSIEGGWSEYKKLTLDTFGYAVTSVALDLTQEFRIVPAE